jgi:hypothetical protein
MRFRQQKSTEARGALLETAGKNVRHPPTLGKIERIEFEIIKYMDAGVHRLTTFFIYTVENGYLYKVILD